MTSVYGYATDHPKRVIALALVVVVSVSPGLLRLRLRTDGNALIPAHAPEIERDRAIRERFGFEDQTIVMIDTGRVNGIYEVGVLRTLDRLAAGIAQIDGLGPYDVTSIVTEKIDHTIPRTLTFRTLLQPFPDTADRMAEFRNDIETVKIYSGTLVANDASAIAILINTPRDMDRARLQCDLQRVIDALGDVPETIGVAGAPIAESQLGTHILDDLLGTRVLRVLARLGLTQPAGEAFREDGVIRTSLILIVFGVMAVVFFVAFRSVFAVLLPLGEVGACLVFTFSVMGWVGVPVYLTIAVLPIILTAIGVADELHIFTRYAQVLRERGDDDASDRVRRAMDDMWRPVVKTSVTSAIGFLSFALSPIEPVKWFGVFMAVGIAFCLLWSLTVIPACLSLLGPKRFSFAGRAKRPMGRLLQRLGHVVLRYRYVCLLGAVVVIGVAPMGLSRLVVQDSWIDAFSPESEVYQTTTRVNEAFFGAHLLLVEVDTGASPDPKMGLLEFPDMANRVRDLERYIESLSGLTVGGVQGYHKAIATAGFLLNNRKTTVTTTPKNQSRIKRAQFYYGRFRGEARRRQLVDRASQRCLLTVFLKDANFIAVGELLRKLRAYEREHLAPVNVSLSFAGDVAVSQAMIGGIVETQTRSLLLSLVGIVVVGSVLSRSVVWGAFCVLPASVAVLMNYAMMGFVGMPLGVATSMFAGMTIGIGVDYAIHFLEQARRAGGNGADTGAAILGGLTHAGPAILVDGLAIALAFGVLTRSQVPANGRLGGLVVLAVVTCLVATLVVLPALLRVVNPRFLRARESLDCHGPDSGRAG